MACYSEGYPCCHFCWRRASPGAEVPFHSPHSPIFCRHWLPHPNQLNIMQTQAQQCMLLSPTNVFDFPQDSPPEVEMRLLDMLAAILQNLASHPDNRTYMYRAELAGTTALDRVLEGPTSPEPADTSASLLANRLSPKKAASSTRDTSSNSSGNQQPGAAAGAAGAGRCGSPVLPQPGRCQSPMLGSSGRTSGGAAAGSLSRSVDTALSAGVVLRPKVVFPPIARSSAGLLASGGAGSREPWTRAGSPDGPRIQVQLQAGSPPASPPVAAADGRSSPSRRGRVGTAAAGAAAGMAGRSGTAGGPRGANLAKSRSVKSRAATSVAGAPGSALAAPDSKEQFLICECSWR